MLRNLGEAATFSRLQSYYLDCTSVANRPSLFLWLQKSIPPFSKLHNVTMMSDDLIGATLKSDCVMWSAASIQTEVRLGTSPVNQTVQI